MAATKTAIVTGAASGIGKAFAARLIERGYRVVLADINDENGEKVEKELGKNSIFQHCDVSNWESQVALFRKAYSWAGHIDLFIANAGIEEQESFWQLPEHVTEEEVAKPNTKVVDVNLYSVLYGLKLFRHYTRLDKTPGQESRMVVTASLAGFYPFPAAPVYSVAKSGLVGLARSTGLKLERDESILISVIAPGPVDTPISEITKKYVPAEHFTPMDLMVKALDKVVDERLGGQVLECSNANMYIREPLAFSDDNTKFLIGDMSRF
ncbi:uncharacterized protein N0V89_011330 [Didymosphaeria variabile]|uniref:NAD(P)-binding protein n=1 Tax=Didymosphaeria variabile TaxID=1932322 RepID=A0A9W8X9U4_9PLEO|nr:uncharacterized protein N0V89_011330 [Didymosphaeria variabile]KAJ4345201.1 hypothetical protein N0V89_011330 [Didymosphaeria variabile]